MKIKFIILTLLTFLACQVYGQRRILTGKVKDSKGEIIIGANIYVENGLNRALAGCVTDINGNYRLAMPSDKNLTIVCSFIGYKSQKVQYTVQSSLNFVLEDDSKTLQTVVVVGERSDRNEVGVSAKNQVSASQKFNMSSIESAPATSIESALEGRLANVDIITGGDPGAKSSIRIRGTSSLNANTDPLIVVDGIPYNTTISSDFNFTTASDEDLGALVNLPPDDIESIEVLKDAVATAIWGSKGANGVLLFKTKKGSKGRTRFSFSNKMEYKKEPPTIPMLDGSQYRTMVMDALGNTINDLGATSGLKYITLRNQTEEINYDPDWVYFKEYNQNTNWVNEISQPAYSSDNNLSISGGGDKAVYRASVGYTNEQGTTLGTGLKRFSSLISVNYKFSDKLRVNSDLSYNQSTTASNYSSDVRSVALTKMPNESPYVLDSMGNRTNQYFTPLQNFQGDYENGGNYNPVALVHEANNNTYARNARIGFSLEYKITPDLQYTGIVGFDMRSTKNRKFLPQSSTGVLYASSYFNRSSDMLSDNLYITSQNKLIYNKTFAHKHTVTVAAIAQTSESRSNAYSSETCGNASASLSDPTAGSSVASMGSGTSLSRNLGFNGNAHYAYKEKYLFDAGYRYEASSSMGANQRWKGFPTLGVGWNFNEEEFLKTSKWLNRGKLRIGWGQSGNSPSGSYPYIGIMSPIANYYTMSSIEPSTIQLDNLKWETVTQTNLGLDLTFFDRLDASFDIYQKTTSDLLQKKVTIPASTGFSTDSYYNSGKVTNKGWEFVLNYTAIKKKDLVLQFNFNISRNVNEVLDLPDNLEFDNYTFKNGAYAYKIIDGNPIGSFYGYKCLGVYQNVDETYVRDKEGNRVTDLTGRPVFIKNGTVQVHPGDAKYQDINNDGVIDQYDITYLGNAMPLVTGGFGFDLTYKNFSLSTFFQGRYGQKIVNQTRINTENMYGADNQSTAVLKRWRHEGDETNIPRALYDQGYNYLGSDRFVEDGSFLRLRTVSLTYRVPKNFIQKLKIDRLDIWLTGYDLYTWTSYSGQDPEVGLSSNIYMLSVDKSATPKTKRFALGLTLNF